MSRYQKNRREPGRFIQIPIIVLNSKAYINLSPSAKALLIDVVSQYKGDNNGKLLAGWRIMSEERGWVSKDTLNRAKNELLESGLLYETRKGARPNKSSWYGATWWHCNDIQGMDIKDKDFPRSLYLKQDRT